MSSAAFDRTMERYPQVMERLALVGKPIPRAASLKSDERLALIGKLDKLATSLPPEEGHIVRMAADLIAYQEAKITLIRSAVE